MKNIKYTKILQKVCTNCKSGLFMVKRKGLVYNENETMCPRCGTMFIKLNFDPNSLENKLDFQRYIKTKPQYLVILVYKTGKAFLEAIPTNDTRLLNELLGIVNKEKGELKYARISFYDKAVKVWGVLDLLTDKKIDPIEMLGFHIEQVYQLLYSKESIQVRTLFN